MLVDPYGHVAAGHLQVGPSFWAEPGPFARMPPDVEQTQMGEELGSMYVYILW